MSRFPAKGMRDFTYLTNCVDCGDGDAINEMREKGREVTYATFRRHCVGLTDVAVSLGYERHAARGLTLKKDPYVAFYKGRYKGEDCFYFVWSAIEYIWTRRKD